MPSRVDNTGGNGKGRHVVDECPELKEICEYTIFSNMVRLGLTKLNLTRLKTLRDRSVNVKILLRFDWTRMNDALDIATSLPEPIAMLTSAVVNA